MPSRAVVWFRRDLRVADHAALLAALEAADQVVPVFVVDRTLLDGGPSGPNRRAFLHGALASLARDLEALGGRLLVREGEPVQLIPALARTFAADAVYCSRDFTPYARRRDPAVERALRADGRRLYALPGNYLSDFDEVRTSSGDPYRVYSPFARAAEAEGWDDPLPAPGRVPVPEELAREGTGPGSGAEPESGAEPGRFDLEGAVELTPPDPAAALQRLAWFVANRVDGYGRDRNRMATDGTSKLSPYLRFGLVSPRQVAAAVKAGGAGTAAGVRLGTDYPRPIVDHKRARDRALSRFQEATGRRP